MASAPGAASASQPEYDVIICGGGITSAAIAYFLTLKGVKPLVVERLEVGAAASGKAGGFLARHWGDGTPTEELHRVSFDLHKDLAEELNLQSYRRIPTLRVKTSPRGRAAARKGGSNDSEVSAAWLDGDELVSATLMDAGTAQVTPMEITRALMDAAVAAGATLRKGVVTGVDTAPAAGANAGAGAAAGAGAGAGERVVTAVRVDDVAIPCKRAVLAMGPWSVMAEEWLGIPVPMEGIKSASVIYRGPALQSAVKSEPYALFCNEDERFGTHLEIYPRADGEVYICGIGGSDYVSGARLRPGGDTESQALVGPDPARVEAAVGAFAGISRLAGGGPPDVAQSCMRPCASDALPILGPVPGVAGAFLATGGNCWGITWAPACGQAMAELLVDGKAACVDLAPFAPGRFLPRAARRGRAQGAAPVGEQW